MAVVSPNCSLPELITRLYDVDGLKFGNFTMRTGEISPVYVDMRVIWSYPDIVVRGRKSLKRNVTKSQMFIWTGQGRWLMS